MTDKQEGVTKTQQAALDALERLHDFEEENGTLETRYGALYVPSSDERRMIFGYATSNPQTLRSIREELEGISTGEIGPNFSTDSINRVMRKDG